MKANTALAILLSATAALSERPKCDYDGIIRHFEKRIGHEDLMKKAKVERFPAKSDAEDARSSITRTSGKKNSRGLLLVNSYLFTGCTLTEVWMENVDPFNADTVASNVAFVRPDSTLQAICPDGKGMWTRMPFSDDAYENKDCFCFVDFHKEKKSRGCLEDRDYDRIEKKYGIHRSRIR